MLNAYALKNWSLRLRNASHRGRGVQTQALLKAFTQIEDAVLREQMVILLEVIASNPQLSAKLKSSDFDNDLNGACIKLPNYN